MVETQCRQEIPTQLDLAEFEQFVLSHLVPGSRGPAPKLSLHKIFNYVLKILYMGCQWKNLPIDKDGEGRPETHYTRIYRIWRRWVDNGCMDAIFVGSVLRLHEDGRLDTVVIHGDGTTTAAKKGGDNLGFNGHKKVKGDKVVAFCDRRCNVIAPTGIAMTTIRVARHRAKIEPPSIELVATDKRKPTLLSERGLLSDSAPSASRGLLMPNSAAVRRGVSAPRPCGGLHRGTDWRPVRRECHSSVWAGGSAPLRCCTGRLYFWKKGGLSSAVSGDRLVRVPVI
jgi:hypothetical protein